MKESKKAFLWIGLLAVTIGIFYDIALRASLYGLNATLIIMLWVVICLVLAYKRRLITAGLLTEAAFAIVAAILIFVRASAVVQFWLTIIGFAMLVLLTIRLSVANSSDLSIFQRYRVLLAQCSISLRTGPSRLLRALQSQNTRQKHIPPGVLIASVLVVVFLLLFATADQIMGTWFSGLTNGFEWLFTIFGDDFPGHIVVTVFWSVVSFFILTTLYVRSKVTVATGPQLRRFLSINDARIIFAALISVFAVFVAIQLRYLFIDGTLPAGLTYASYARQGYGQLLIATALAAMVIKYVLSSIKTDYARTEKILATVLLLLNAFIILAAWKRLSLYETAYGWTMLRFMAHVGLVTIGLGSITLLGWVWQRFSSRTFYRLQWYTLAGVLLLTAVLNPDGIVAGKNITERPHRTASLDTIYLSSLSADSLPAVCKHASSLAQQHPDEYEALKNAQINRLSHKNLGISRHYTQTKQYLDSYANCLN